MKNPLFINQVRQYKPDCTISEVFLPLEPKRFCYALEDIGRPLGVKVAGQTCIGEGTYRLTATYSNRFKKRMLLVSNTPAGTVVRHGITFEGVRVHGGNTVADTLGCPLYAYQYDGKSTVSQRASDDLLAWVDEQEASGFEVYLTITSNDTTK